MRNNIALAVKKYLHFNDIFYCIYISILNDTVSKPQLPVFYQTLKLFYSVHTDGINVKYKKHVYLVWVMVRASGSWTCCISLAVVWKAEILMKSKLTGVVRSLSVWSAPVEGSVSHHTITSSFNWPDIVYSPNQQCVKPEHLLKTVKSRWHIKVRRSLS